MSSFAAAREGSRTRATAPSGRPAAAAASCRASMMAQLERMASEPPRRMQALPLLMQMAAASLVTLGRDSKMMPTTPRGTRFCRMRRPLGRVHMRSAVPMGSGRVATSSRPRAMSSTRASVRVSRSIKADFTPFSPAARRSSAFACKIAPQCARSACAMARSAPSRTEEPSVAISRAALRACFPKSETMVMPNVASSTVWMGGFFRKERGASPACKNGGPAACGESPQAAPNQRADCWCRRRGSNPYGENSSGF